MEFVFCYADKKMLLVLYSGIQGHSCEWHMRGGENWGAPPTVALVSDMFRVEAEASAKPWLCRRTRAEVCVRHERFDFRRGDATSARRLNSWWAVVEGNSATLAERYRITKQDDSRSSDSTIVHK